MVSKKEEVFDDNYAQQYVDTLDAITAKYGAME